jgi:hypothetical protein
MLSGYYSQDAVFKTYASYCSAPRAAWIDELLQVLFEYPIGPHWPEESQRYLDAYLNTPVCPAQGTAFITNQLTEYRFGPFDKWIFTRVERHLEDATKEEYVVVNVNPSANVVKRNYVAINPFSDDWGLQLIGYLRHEQRIRYLYAQPSCLIFLLRNAEVVEFLKNVGIGIISTGEPFPFDRSSYQDLYINNKMINWRSGLNFWTCRHGGTHWLPLFARRSGRLYNLLNLVDKSGVEEDDLFSIGASHKCSCGATSSPMSIISHVQNHPRERTTADVGRLLSELKGVYFNLQYVEDRVGSHLLFTPIGRQLPEDLSVLKSWGCRLWPNSFLKVGRKRPVVWKMDELSFKPYTEERYWLCKEPVVLTFTAFRS